MTGQPISPDAVSPRPAASRPWWRALAALLAATWLVLAAIDCLLASWLPRATLVDESLTFGSRLALQSDELLLLALAVAAVAGALAGAWRASWRWAARPTWLRGLCAGLILAGAGAAIFLYAASWAAFRSTGAFLAPDGLVFFASNALQFMQHVAQMEPWSLVILPLLVSAATAAVAWWAPRLWSGLRRDGALLCGAGGVLLACLLTSMLSPRLDRGAQVPVLDPRAGVVYSFADLYDYCRSVRTGPMLCLWSAAAQRWRPAVPLPIDESIAITRRPIVSMDDYVAGLTARPTWNVLVIEIESLRVDQLVACGGPREVMPAVEALARESRVFTRTYAQASHSNYADLCPLNSLYPLRSEQAHVYRANDPAPRAMIYDCLKPLGYRTAVISSQDENWGGMLNHLQTPGLDHLFHAATFDGPTYVPHGDSGFEAFVKGDKRAGKIDDRFTVGEVMRWIDEAGAPFVAYVNLQSSHIPYETPADFPRRFGTGHLPFAIRFNDYPRESAALVWDEYANSLAYLDSQLGRLLEHLRSRNLWNTTIIVLTGDNGQAFYEHGFAGHANELFDECLRVPLLIHAPGLAHGLDTRLAQHVDVPPTVLGLLGLPPHPSFQGMDLLGPDPGPDRTIYVVAQSPLAHQVAVVQGRYKLIYDVRRRDTVLLDLQDDPAETRNVKLQHPEVAARLAARLNTWRVAQLEYYSRLGEHGRTFPPVLADGPGAVDVALPDHERAIGSMDDPGRGAATDPRAGAPTDG